MNIVTVGGATLDIIVAGMDGAMRLAGAKQDVSHIRMYPGGGAVNTALRFKELGARTTILCAVGDDIEGRLLLDALRKEDIGLDQVQIVTTHATGKAVIHVDAVGHAQVFAQRGASGQLCIPVGGFSAEIDVLYVSSLSDPATAQLAHALHMGARRPRKVVFNPGARQVKEHSMAFLSLMKAADLVCVNEHEAQLLTNSTSGFDQDLDCADAARLVVKISRIHECEVLLTLGSRGALYKNASGVTYHPALPIKPKSTLGAGDAFCSTFAFCWASGMAPTEALERGVGAAGEVINTLAGNLAKPIGGV